MPLLIIDGHYHLFRFYNGIPHAAQLPDGTRVNAVYGFMAMLRKLLTAYPDCNMIVVFDSETGTSDKREHYNEYKAKRPAPEDSLFNQLDIIKVLLYDVSIPWIEDPEHEGDDVICSLARQMASHHNRRYIVSNDKDFYQLVDNGITILNEQNGRITEIDTKWIQRKLNISPRQYPLYLSLTGDKSDNIKGIAGIGPIRASRIIGASNNIDDILYNNSHIHDHFIALLHENAQRIKANTEFFTMKADIELADKVDTGMLGCIKHELLANTVTLLKRNGFG